MNECTITVGELIAHLSIHDKSLPVYFGGLSFYRTKDRGGLVQIEFAETVYKDDMGNVVVTNHDLPSDEE